MTDPASDTSTLLLLFEEQVAALLELPEKERALAFEKLRAAHPNHARLLERCEWAAASLTAETRSLGALSDAVRTATLAEAPERIGDYRILDVLGEGGMGIVYLADQQHPVRRRVALKVIKHVGASRAVLARFEIERQSLALMNHPGIAKVFDAGEAADGRPFFAMEYVPGIAITEFCDRQHLGLRARIGLLRKVCHAVQHAHDQGVIHRDLKPGNILVLQRDGLAEPMIIDFGVAKALQQRLTERTHFTEHGRILGTPEYMSPEQAEMSGRDPDARTDVYSLGVVLYELLVGALPFDSQKLRAAGYLEIQRRIREEEPTKPSTRFTTATNTTTEIARRRSTDRGALLRALRGDLDCITMRCLEKDPVRRYSSARDLADELERYLESRPVLAGPPSLVYRLRKAMRRQRYVLMVAAAIVVALTVGLSLPGIVGAGDPTEEAGPTVSVVCPLHDDHGGISPNGRYLTYTDWSDGNLMVHDTATGQARRLTTDARWGKDDGTDPSRSASFSGIGPDNRTVAYSWQEGSVSELRILDVEGGTARTVARDPTVDALGFYDFSRSGDEVLVVAERAKGGSTLEFVRLADGSRRIVTGLRAVRSSTARISPDGMWIAYEDIVDAATTRRQLQIVATAGGVVRPLAASRGFDARPCWTPDGRHVVFQSDRGGSRATWAVEVGGGEAVGTAFQVDGLAGIHPFRFLADGSFVYGKFEPSYDVFVGDYAPDRTPAISGSRRIPQSFLGSNYAPCWSPDGRTLAYLSPRGELVDGDRTIALVLHDLETGAERTLETPGYRLMRWHQVGWRQSSPPRFASDGRRIVLSGSDGTGAVVVRSVDVTTGQVATIAIPDAVRPCRVQPLEGGGYLYNSMTTEGLFEYSGATGEIRKLTDRFGRSFLTGDGQQIVVCEFCEAIVISRTDRTERSVYTAPPATRLLGLLLARDGGDDWLVVQETDVPRLGPVRHVRIRVRDARAEPFEIEPNRPIDVVAASPDGRRWAYHGASGRDRPGQVWRWRGSLLE